MQEQVRSRLLIGRTQRIFSSAGFLLTARGEYSRPLATLVHQSKRKGSCSSSEFSSLLWRRPWPPRWSCACDWLPIGRAQKIFSSTDLAARRECSQQMASYWPHAENILINWLPFGRLRATAACSYASAAKHTPPPPSHLRTSWSLQGIVL